MTKRLTIALVALAVFVLVAVLPVSASTNYLDIGPGCWTIVYPGQTVFFGEQGLNVTAATRSIATLTSATLLWYPANSLSTSNPSQSVTIDPRSFFADPNTFSVATYGATQTWYVNSTYNLQSGLADRALQNATVALVLQDPAISLDIRDYTQDTTVGKVVSGLSVPQGNNLSFAITSNLWPIYTQRNFTVDVGHTTANGALGFVNIKIKTDQGATLSSLVDREGLALSTYDQNPNASLWYWANNTAGDSNAPATVSSNHGIWYTAAKDSASNNFLYPAGTYTISAEVRLNHMKDNYKDPSGVDYTGKTVTSARTVTLVSDTVQISANKDTVVRGNPFSVTVTGKPNTYYFVFLKGISSLTGNPFGNATTAGYGNTPPTIDTYQTGVTLNLTGGIKTIEAGSVGTSTYVQANDTIANYTYTGSTKIGADQPSDATSLNGTYYRAIIKTDDSGKRTIQFSTSRITKDQKFTVRVQRDNTYTVPQDYYNMPVNTVAGTDVKSDSVDITVTKGTVTIVAAGDQSYYLGEEIKLSGTNTESKYTYLFISGPNIGATYGADLTSVTTDSATHTLYASVLSDNTWSYKWSTSNIALDAGTYTIYAASDAVSKTNLGNATYGTVSIVIKKPFVSATASQATVAKGDKFFITGTAEGNPSQGVQIWMLGKNFVGPDTTNRAPKTQSVNADATFSYEVTKTVTKDLATGQYFVVVQHPMYNNRLDINYNTTSGGVENYVTPKVSGAYQTVFYLSGTSAKLQGSDAAEALIEAINSPNVDDTYTKLSVLIEQPVINVDTIKDHYVGDKFTITGTTNLAVGDNILVEVTSSSFKPTQKTQSGEFSGASGTVQVVKGTDGANKWSFDVDASTFKPDEYLVKATAVEQDATGTSLFNVLEGTPVTATPTKAPTAAATTVAATTVATPVPTATPTKTPTQPGFGALVALIGLGAVAFLVVRRN